MVDWHRGDLRHGVTALLVDPHNLTDVRGELANVTGGKLDLSFYGDTRMGAELTTKGDHGWDGSAAVQIIHNVSDYTGTLLTEALFTGFVTEAPWESEDDSLSVTWSLSGALHAFEAATADQGWSIAKGDKALDHIRSICSRLHRPYVIASSALQYVYGANKVYEAGTSFLSILSDICSTSRNRLSVDALGRLTIGRYVAPSSRGIDFYADEREPRGMVIGPVKGDTGRLTTPSRVIVRADNGTSTVTGTASVANGSKESEGVRGYRVDRFEAVSDLSPFTREAAQKLANRLLDESISELPSIQHGLTYRPLREGQIEHLTRKDGTSARWMISNASLDLTTWKWELDLKGGWI